MISSRAGPIIANIGKGLAKLVQPKPGTAKTPIGTPKPPTNRPNIRTQARNAVGKVNTGLAIVGGTAISLATLAQTPASVQNIENVTEATKAASEASGEFGKAAQGFSDFIQKNPLLIYGALGLVGLAVVVSIFKK